MINQLSVGNFKKFRRDVFEFAPLTVLTGVNGGGKSTIAQALMLANRAANSATHGVGLNDEAGLALGTASDVLATDADSTVVSISISESREYGWSCDVGDSLGSSFLTMEPTRRWVKKPTVIADLTYLSAGRHGPRMSESVRMSAEGSTDLGVDGRFLASTLAAFSRFVVPDERRHESASSVLLVAQTEAWLGSIVGQFQLDAQIVPRSDIAKLMIRSGNSDEWMLPTNTGFGITFVLPVIVAGLLANIGSVLVVDSPEAHLHPAAQSGIGRFLATLATAGVQVVVETHSDHVVNGIRLAIADGTLNAPDALIHYFGESDHATVSSNGKGGLNHWPRGFFDQAQHDLAKLARRRQ